MSTKTTAAEYKNGAATWVFNLDKAATTVSFTVKDAQGNAVDTAEGTAPAGESRFVWDGLLADGSTAPAGNYTISIAAVDKSGAAISARTSMTGIVDGVDMSGVEPYLMIGNARIALGSVTSVRTPR